ncbi:putative prolyl aminopeptidase [Actinoplanes friuliensis DSM 7358]|uniref:Putative prolyl aminopeptidase n=1 Tax=Actinoplanes friuliensis DSM 7358 TaxID=1246995 RepID=U5W3X4_9ACTN|nr:putative prolyl aminopeptidase [Actinoplanes friuliensis DSM 7358]
MAVRDHTIAVPLDHADPDGATIDVFAREVVSPARAGDDLPWLLFLQGGPGGKSPRPLQAEAWLARALKTHRVLLLDQRGTGRSTPVTARTVAGMEPERLAAYLRLFRADSIVADAEIARERIAGVRQWETLGQSYGGFITLAYLSRAPESLRACYVTGGLPGLTTTADDVYARTYPRVAAKNAEFYREYPQDVATVRRIADHLEANEVFLPDGDRFTARRLRVAGSCFGMSDGYARIHWMLDEAWHGKDLSDGFLYQMMMETAFVDMPIFALQEFTYGQGTFAANWSADRELANHPEFAADADPLLFTGEMFYPWMFREIRSLEPFAAAADLLAAHADWPILYDAARLATNEVPVRAAVYFDDMYVDANLQLETARAVGNTRVWITNAYEHNGLRAAGEYILDRLMGMVDGRY